MFKTPKYSISGHRRWLHHQGNTRPKKLPVYSERLVVGTGYAAGHHWNHNGGGSNQLCLSEEPQWKNHTVGTTATNSATGWLYGIEYVFAAQFHILIPARVSRRPIPCAVCYVPRRSASVMIPASTSCPAGWTQEYGGLCYVGAFVGADNQC